jgi:hypothetical protein
VEKNIVKVEIRNSGGCMEPRQTAGSCFTARVHAQLKALFAAWEKAGLIDRILTFNGSFRAEVHPRSQSVLSTQAFGQASTSTLRGMPLA